MATEKWEVGSITTLLSTELNSLANGGSSALGTEYDNSVNLYLYGMFELTVTFATAPTANSLVNLYLVGAPDGTNYDDGSATVTPPFTSYLGAFPLRAVTTAQRVPLGGVGINQLLVLPPIKFKLLAVNNSGQAFPASGSTIKLLPYRRQIV